MQHFWLLCAFIFYTFLNAHDPLLLSLMFPSSHLRFNIEGLRFSITSAISARALALLFFLHYSARLLFFSKRLATHTCTCATSLLRSSSAV
ncbi:hypothetical protein BDQ12DRAFT_690327 [Crucibulum laeve]|uniref:Secreted protein n=1 Tax=Crucibulum laeve TaxID=68775 RepID=A0A5C3LLR3_9AGAR|nr:hypothetical protein BDQ12DRAFT_690327 [Crucibulum laeve]